MVITEVIALLQAKLTEIGDVECLGPTGSIAGGTSSESLTDLTPEHFHVAIERDGKGKPTGTRFLTIRPPK